MKTQVLQKFPIPAPELEIGQSITTIAEVLETGQLLAISSGMTQIIAKVAGNEGHRILPVSTSLMGRPFNLTIAASKGAANICA